MISLKQNEYVSRPLPAVQMIALIDILFINLSFFMAMSMHFNFESELNISVPQAKTSAESAIAPQDVIVNILKDGKVVVNQKALTLPELTEVLQRMAQLYPNQAVILRADEKTFHENVVRVLDSCAQAKIWNISFATVKESR